MNQLKYLRTDLKISCTVLEVDGTVYYVTAGTGERFYGSDGGSVAFAYEADDVEELETLPESYQDFCDRILALDDEDPNWTELSVRCAQRGLRLTRPGSCVPALSDREYGLIQLTRG